MANRRYTIRAVPDAIDSAVRRRAGDERKSRNAVVLEALARGLKPDAAPAASGHPAGAPQKPPASDRAARRIEDALKKKFRRLDAELRKSNEDHPLRRRLRQALAWLGRANAPATDPAVQYLLLRMAFSAACADGRGAGDGSGKRLRCKRCFDRLTKCDEDRRIADLLRGELSEPILELVENGRTPGKERRQLRKRLAAGEGSGSGRRKDTVYVLRKLFERLDALGGQIVHGAAPGQLARTGRGVQVLAALVPALLDVMMDHPFDASA